MLGSEVISQYNNVLAQSNKDYIYMDIWVDNQSLYRICENQLGIESPSQSDINRLIAQ